jgi:hypothetical protein
MSLGRNTRESSHLPIALCLKPDPKRGSGGSRQSLMGDENVDQNHLPTFLVFKVECGSAQS